MPSFNRIRSTFNVAVLNALWLITASKRMDYHDPEIRKIVDSLYIFLIDTAKPIANIGFQVRWHKICKSCN